MLCTSCSRPVRPLVAVDIDGTLGNYHDHFVAFAENYLGFKLPKEYAGDTEFSEYLGLEKKEYRDIKLAYRQGGMKRNMPIYEGAAEFMRQLQTEDIEVWIATTRPWLRLDNIDPDTRHWLERRKIDYDGMIYGEDKYEQLISLVEQDRIIVVVEDLREEVDRATALLLNVWQPERKHNRRASSFQTFSSFPELTLIVRNLKRRWNHGQQARDRRSESG